MPRTGRGGSRSGMGTVGAKYANRTDIPAPPPNQAAPGQEYGTAQQQNESMRQIPVAPPPSPAVAQGPIAGSVGATSAAQPPPQAAPAGMGPGELPWTQTPTQRPAEPITAGMPVGPGPGPEALANGWGTGTAQPGTSTAQLITALASMPGANSTLKGLANIAQANRAG